MTSFPKLKCLCLAKLSTLDKPALEADGLQRWQTDLHLKVWSRYT